MAVQAYNNATGGGCLKMVAHRQHLMLDPSTADLQPFEGLAPRFQQVPRAEPYLEYHLILALLLYEFCLSCLVALDVCMQTTFTSIGAFHKTALDAIP